MLLHVACRGGADVPTDAPGTDASTDSPSLPPPDTDGGADSGPEETGLPTETVPPTDTGTPAPTYWSELDAVCINEFMANNALSYLVDGVAWDWIELHNAGPDAVALDGWSLTDDDSDPTKFAFPLGTVLAPGEYRVWLASGDETLGVDHLPFSLDQDGEEVGLFAPSLDGEVVTFDALTTDVSAYRTVDCGYDTWERGWLGTPGASNVP